MPTILIEEDHFLKIVPVVIDLATPAEHQRAVAAFFAHDVPDFPGWCAKLRDRLPALASARVVWAGDENDMRAKLRDADAVIVESFRIDRAALADAERLAVVQKFGTLTANIDRTACAERGVAVEILHRHVNIAVAEQAFALMMTLGKRICELNGVVEADALEARGYRVRPRSPHIGYSNFAGIPGLKTMFGATLGIVGLGEVGRDIARRAAAFGMTTLYHQRTRMPAADEAELRASHVSLADLMARSDYIIVQLPSNASTLGIIGRAELEQVKPGAVLINCARPELIDRAAVVAALQSGRLGGLGLDVGYTEPTRADDPLLKFKSGNVILMPHTAIAGRANALHDVETLCVNLNRHIAAKAALG